jgi:chromosome segregation and condensation protein ScpB
MDKEGASTVFGATKKDYEYLGIKQTEGDVLAKKLKEKGGKMDMKDLMSVLKSEK